jgi:hypothetical protein
MSTSSFKNDIEDRPIIVPKATMDLLLKQPKPADLITLYCLYYYTAIWQKTNQCWCTDGYVKKKLGWGRDKTIAARKRLASIGLIEKIQTRPTGEKAGSAFGKAYIKVNYYYGKEAIDEALKTRLSENSAGREQATYAYSSSKEYACNSNKEYASNNDVEDEKTPKKADVNKSTDKGTKAQRLAEFETFWKTYPIVRGTKPEKKRALRYWKVVVPNRISYQGILDKLTEDIKSEQWLKKDGQYIPAPCTYLNPDNERWTDELSPVVPIVHEPDPAMLEALDQTCLQNLREAETPPTLEQFEAANCEWYHESNRNKAIAYIKSYYAA